MLDILDFPRANKGRIDVEKKIRKNKNLKIIQDKDSDVLQEVTEKIIQAELSVFEEFLIPLMNLDALGDFSLDMNNDDIIQILVEKSFAKSRGNLSLNQNILDKLGVRYITLSSEQVKFF